MTPEEKQKDLDERVKGFNEEMIPLLGKYHVGLGAVPMMLADGRIGAKPALLDDTKPVVGETPAEQVPTLTPA